MIESGAMYWVKLLHAAGAEVHIVDAKRAKRFAESLCASGAKDDARDARTLSLMGCSPCHIGQPWTPPSDMDAALSRLSSAISRTTESKTRSLQQLRSLLREMMPTVEMALPVLRYG